NKITRDVILDLLPVYLSGEASAGTKALVEEFMTRDPELRELARLEGSPIPPLTQSPPDELERRALRTTQRLLSQKSWSLVLALLLTVFPIVAYWGEDTPIEPFGTGLILMTIVLAGAFVLWGLFFRICRRI